MKIIWLLCSNGSIKTMFVRESSETKLYEPQCVNIAQWHFTSRSQSDFKKVKSAMCGLKNMKYKSNSTLFEI